MAFETVIRKARFQSFGYTGEQMKTAADGLIAKGILPRMDRAQDASDSPAPALSPGYAKQKESKGAQPVRDWLLTGETRRSMKTVSAGPNLATIGFIGSRANQRAAIQNARSRQFAVSPSDRGVLGHEFEQLPPPVRAVQV